MRTVSCMRFWQYAICAMLLVSCDSFAPETEIPFTFSVNEYYILPGSSIVIDLKSVIKQSFASASLSIAQSAVRGTATQLDPFLLKYTPHADFQQGTDQIVVSVQLDDGSMRKGTIDIIMRDRINDFACGTYAVEDRIDVRSRSTVIIHPLKNDRVCGNKGLVNVLIHRGPQHGEAVVSGDSIIFRPDTSFELGDELVYRLTDADGDNVAYGILSIRRTTVEALNNDTGALVDILFVNDTTGFLVGNRSIFKTYDGGGHWAEVYDLPDPASFHEIFFLNKDTGYAAFSICTGSDDDWECPRGGWIKTNNGGLSWERIDLNVAVGSIFFTSPSMGFISTTTFEDLHAVHRILKTKDGGETWDQVATSNAPYGFLKIRFASDDIGYAIQVDKVFHSTDGGNSWFNSANNYIISVAVASENVMSASFSIIDQPSVTMSSAIYRSVGGGTWKPVTSFPYLIMQHSFSPSGDLGIAVGISGPNPLLDPESYILTISKSVDKGLTWVDLPDEITGLPLAMSVPSENVAYILCWDKIIKYVH